MGLKEKYVLYDSILHVRNFWLDNCRSFKENRLCIVIMLCILNEGCICSFVISVNYFNCTINQSDQNRLSCHLKVKSYRKHNTVSKYVMGKMFGWTSKLC